MRALLQRVSRASVTVDDEIVGQIGQGLLVLLGVGQDDSEVQVKTLVDKIVHLRIFGDDKGKMIALCSISVEKFWLSRSLRCMLTYAKDITASEAIWQLLNCV